MSGIYQPGAFKKKKEEESLVENGVVPKPITDVKNSWGGRTTFADLMKGVELKPEESSKKNDSYDDPIPYVKLPNLRDIDRKNFIKENVEDLEELYDCIVNYDEDYFDKLRDNENGFKKFSEFVFSLI